MRMLVGNNLTWIIVIVTHAIPLDSLEVRIHEKMSVRMFSLANVQTSFPSQVFFRTLSAIVAGEKFRNHKNPFVRHFKMLLQPYREWEDI